MAQKSLRDSLYLTDNPQETTFKYDDELPSLPLPQLRESVLKLLESIKPIAPDEASFREVERRALEFIQDANVQELQRLLEKRAQSSKNWLESWWLEFAYLRSRKPLVPYSNMAAPLPIKSYWPALKAGQPGYEDAQLKRAALSTYFQLCFWKMLRSEQMRPMIHKGVPWSMSQFRYLFNTVRRPGEQKDELLTWFRTARQGAPESLELIVLHRGHIFALQAITLDEQQRPHILTAPQIESQLASIVSRCRDKPYGPCVGALTTSERGQWAENRKRLEELSDQNRQLLQRIDKALTVLVLDENEPANEDEIFRLSITGDPRNRWVDKSITSIAFRNGTFGASADHTPYDGFCTGIMTHYLITSAEECEGVWSDRAILSDVDPKKAVYRDPAPLEFDLNDELKKSIGECCTQFHSVSSTIDTIHRTFKHFGKAILKEYRVHPEALVQCALHAAYYKQTGRMAPTYVTASTRKFFNGRTETCRSCYPEMHELARHLSEQGANRPREAFALLKKAADKFQKVMEEATNGMGCDRHLMGIYLTALLEGKDIPTVFEDELVLRTNNYILSTSCGGYWNVCGGVPPLVDEGYGCFYGIEDNQITFCCTAYKHCPETDLANFYDHVHRALLDMQRVMLNAKL